VFSPSGVQSWNGRVLFLLKSRRGVPILTGMSNAVIFPIIKPVNIGQSEDLSSQSERNCAWCFPPKEGDPVISHSICARHKAELLAGLKAKLAVSADLPPCPDTDQPSKAVMVRPAWLNPHRIQGPLGNVRKGFAALLAPIPLETVVETELQHFCRASVTDHTCLSWQGRLTSGRICEDMRPERS
jgi:hypothetical protein